MSRYSNPTENAAIGAVDRQIRTMRRRAERLAALKRRGLLTPEELEAASRDFTGIFARFLREALSGPAPDKK